MSLVIETKDLSRIFKSYEKPEGLIESLKGFWSRKHVEKTALAPTTLQIESGQIIGLVGSNGAGKTTLLKLLSGLIHPTSGTAKVLGYEPWKRDARFLRQMSILLGQKNQLWWDLAPKDSFSLLADIYDLDKKKASTKVMDLAEMLECRHVLTTQLRRLSLGERMKMEIIGSLLHDPKILYLDEPTIGLDIVAQTGIRKFLDEYVKNKGPTVILTSHYMDDIAKLADRLLLISKGSIVYDGTVGGFVAKSESLQKITFNLSEPLKNFVALGEGLRLEPYKQEFSVEVKAEKLAGILAQITQLPGVHNLKFEEADFEDIIHRYLEKESRVLPISRHLQP